MSNHKVGKQLTFQRKQLVRKPVAGYHQQGGTMWGLLFNCAIVLFIMYIGAKLVPVYNANSAIGNALESAVSDIESIQNFSERRFIKSMNKRLYVDGVGIPNFPNSMSIEKTKDTLKVVVAYEEKVPLFYNIGLYLEFENTAEK
jgi:hypothetical protein